ncbi:uncharacterized protein SPPG_07013 [Spizellomyces punctatus DAOM BR117]|uniref:Homeobox domain-containing protein n=1 Tax=Spizellomyces punctatus (strain DAOM BR117) TaxID=645134 RepID=A0A0L0HA43_SPIPD|nr:uncharacterized protein SPPG_07013 [Spizellomyces punctatus DAOM BR117]KNC97538.1 hypothetical protein SPPG_07013 [Spizellomyces punctatus DAOM BR117]|eukprot:XP_016605578.1 hypothetical protein SPPG_07013 [Spizellomyces punctatus DAOM BR117]
MDSITTEHPIKYEDIPYGLDHHTEAWEQYFQLPPPTYSQESSAPSSQEGKKRTRRVLNPQQQQILEDLFIHIPNPDTKLRATLAAQLNLPARNIQVWFQNRRAKYRRHTLATEADEKEFAQIASGEDTAASATESMDEKSSVSPPLSAKGRRSRRAASRPYQTGTRAGAKSGKGTKTIPYPSPNMCDAFTYGVSGALMSCHPLHYDRPSVLGVGTPTADCECIQYDPYVAMSPIDDTGFLPQAACLSSYYMQYGYIPDSPPLDSISPLPLEESEAIQMGDNIVALTTSPQMETVHTANGVEMQDSEVDNVHLSDQHSRSRSPVCPPSEDGSAAAASQRAESMVPMFSQDSALCDSPSAEQSSVDPDAYLQAIYGNMSAHGHYDCPSIYHSPGYFIAPQPSNAAAPPCVLTRSQSFHEYANPDMHRPAALRRRHSIATFDPSVSTSWPGVDMSALDFVDPSMPLAYYPYL